MNRSKYLGSFKVADGVYVEKFDPIGKTPQPREISYWITDSVNFKVYLNTFSPDEGVAFQSKGDTIQYFLVPNGVIHRPEYSKITFLSKDSLRKLANYNTIPRNK